MQTCFCGFSLNPIRPLVFALLAAATVWAAPESPAPLISLQRKHPQAPAHRSNRILVKPKSNMPIQRLRAQHQQRSIRLRRHHPGLGGLQVLELPAGVDPEQAVRHYLDSGLVEFAELDYAVQPALAPNDPKFNDGTQWALNNYGQSGGKADADIDAPEAWDTTYEAPDIIIAIVDTGVRYTHEDLAANMWVNPGEIPANGIDDDKNGYIDDVHGINSQAGTGNPMDNSGHGTQVAGIAAAVGGNGKGICGLAWRARLMACRFYDPRGMATISDMVECIDYARIHGAHIINASFVTTMDNLTLRTTIEACRDEGILIVAAAGNASEGIPKVPTDIDQTPVFPASYTYENLVTVAASTRQDVLGTFSNFGATNVDLAAPGDTIYTTHITSDSSYIFNAGTSFATPFVSASLALLKARYPTDTYRQIIQRLLSTVDPLPALAGKCRTGGRLNLARALGPSFYAEFTSTSATGAAPWTLTFTNQSYGSITNLVWHFGDGATSTEPHPTHIYTQPGEYLATLVVTSKTGAAHAKSIPVSVLAAYQPRATEFVWIDPAGMQQIPLGNDGVSGPYPLPFSFPFFGQAQSQIYIGANGLAGFSLEGLTLASNTDLPRTNAPNNILCPFWDDLSPADAGSVTFGAWGTAPFRRAVISWVGVPYRTAPTAAFSFQLWLEESTGRIGFNYLNVAADSANPAASGKSATIGLENSSGSLALQYAYNGSQLLSNGMALVFESSLPTLPSIRLLQESPLILQVDHLGRRPCEILASADLRSWQPISTNTPDIDGVVRYIEIQPLGGSRYYRARTLP